MNPSWRVTCLAAVMGAALLAAAGCSGGGGTPPAEHRPAPDFSLPALDGTKVALSAHRGEVVLLDFWATWCEPCHDTIPVFERLHKQYRDKGFLVVGINVDGSAEYVPDFVKRFRMSYPVVLDDDWKVMQAYKVRGIPNMFLVDKKGRLRKHWIGLDDDLEKTMESEVQRLLQET